MRLGSRIVGWRLKSGCGQSFSQKVDKFVFVVIALKTHDGHHLLIENDERYVFNIGFARIGGVDGAFGLVDDDSRFFV